MLRDSEQPSSLHHATAGFALAALVLATVAVVVPEVDRVAGGDVRAAALADVNAIGAAWSHAMADLGDPCDVASDRGPEWLFGPGVLPRGRVLSRNRRFPLSGILASDRVGLGEQWRGPYLANLPIDPWGRAYVVIAGGTPGKTTMLVVSAGADGVIDTIPDTGRISDDDVGIALMP